MSLHYSVGNSCLFVNRKEILSLKPTRKELTFQHNFVLEVYLMDLEKHESREVSLNVNVYDFLVDYSSINKSVILNIHKYLMTKIL